MPHQNHKYFLKKPHRPNYGGRVFGIETPPAVDYLMVVGLFVGLYAVAYPFLPKKKK